jgi:hypothetical protein
LERQKIDLALQDEKNLLAATVHVRAHVLARRDDHLEAGVLVSGPIGAFSVAPRPAIASPRPGGSMIPSVAIAQRHFYPRRPSIRAALTG